MLMSCRPLKAAGYSLAESSSISSHLSQWARVSLPGAGVGLGPGLSKKSKATSVVQALSYFGTRRLLECSLATSACRRPLDGSV